MAEPVRETCTDCCRLWLEFSVRPEVSLALSELVCPRVLCASGRGGAATGGAAVRAGAVGGAPVVGAPGAGASGDAAAGAGVPLALASSASRSMGLVLLPGAPTGC